jgi:hypothetical protein
MTNVTALPPRLNGRKLSNEELDEIRAMLDSMDSFGAVTPEMRKLIETQWPDLAARLPPE